MNLFRKKPVKGPGARRSAADEGIDLGFIGLDTVSNDEGAAQDVLRDAAGDDGEAGIAHLLESDEMVLGPVSRPLAGYTATGAVDMPEDAAEEPAADAAAPAAVRPAHAPRIIATSLTGRSPRPRPDEGADERLSQLRRGFLMDDLSEQDEAPDAPQDDADYGFDEEPYEQVHDEEEPEEYGFAASPTGASAGDMFAATADEDYDIEDEPLDEPDLPAVDAAMVQVPLPTSGRAGPRAGRVKTRLLGFEHASTGITDPFDAAAPGGSPRQERFPVGWIVVAKGPGLGASFTLFNGVSQIGRGKDQAVSLDFGDTSISRSGHAVIAYDSEQKKFFVGHGGKANIVRLNNQPVLSTEPLSDGDEIRIGETTLRFVALCGARFDWDTAMADQPGDADEY